MAAKCWRPVVGGERQCLPSMNTDAAESVQAATAENANATVRQRFLAGTLFLDAGGGCRRCVDCPGSGQRTAGNSAQGH